MLDTNSNSARDVHISCCLTDCLGEASIRDAVAQLSVEERVRHDRIVSASDRRDFAFAHALLRRSLSAAGDRAPHEWTFTAGRHGKPALQVDEAPALSFNLTHTRGFVACAVTREAELGLDAEAIDREIEVFELADRFFARAEAADLRRCSADTRLKRFAEMWTLKEAYLKALGDGLSRPLDEFAMRLDDRSSLRFEAGGAVRLSAWRFVLFAPSDRHRLAIAINSSSPQDRRLIVHAEPCSDGQISGAMAPVREWPVGAHAGLDAPG